ncbi:unnamed protein product, partial [Discosporangium mesarthrocarpum]
MKCAIANALGDTDTVISMASDWPEPKRTPGKGELKVRVKTCSLARSDAIMMKGDVAMVLKPPSFPYIPGMDICGVVEEADEDSEFKAGDWVVANNGAMPTGGLAEVAVVQSKFTGKKPSSATPLEAAATISSVLDAFLAVRSSRIKPGDRVLVLGGSGGVGLATVQLVRQMAGASYVAATSTQGPMLTALGVDKVINYGEANWWEDPDFQKEPFDAIIDCVGADSSTTWKHACRSRALKSRWRGGRFVAVSVSDSPQMSSVWQGLSFFVPVIWRGMWTFFQPFYPSFTMFLSDPKQGEMGDMLRLVEEGKVRAVLEPSSPYAFTE